MSWTSWDQALRFLCNSLPPLISPFRLCIMTMTDSPIHNSAPSAYVDAARPAEMPSSELVIASIAIGTAMLMLAELASSMHALSIVKREIGARHKAKRVPHTTQCRKAGLASTQHTVAVQKPSAVHCQGETMQLSSWLPVS